MCTQIRAGGYQLNEHGARAMAQAGAFAARANDLSAMFFNPAGLSFQRGFQIMMGATLITPSYSFYGPSNLNSNQRWDMNSNLFFPPNLYVANTWTDGTLKGFAAGIGVLTPFGLGTEWADDWVGRSVTRETELQTFYVMPTVSYAVNHWLSFGVGGNVVFSSVRMRRAVTNFDPELDLVLDGSGDPAFSWNAGMIVKPMENVSLGFSYRAETAIDFTGTANFNPPQQLASLFPGGDVSTSLTPPATWFAAVAWSPVRDFDVELDFQGIQWSSYDKLEVDFKVNRDNSPGVAQSNLTMPKEYENAYIIRLGAEYRIPMLGLAFRGGYLYDRNPVPDRSLEPSLPDSDRHGLNVGIGISILPNLNFDLAYMHLMFMDRVTEATTHPEGVHMNGRYTGSVDLIGFNITYSL